MKSETAAMAANEGDWIARSVKSIHLSFSARHASAWFAFERDLPDLAGVPGDRVLLAGLLDLRRVLGRRARAGGTTAEARRLEAALRLVEVEDDRLLLRVEERVALLRRRIDEERDAAGEHRVAGRDLGADVGAHARALQADEDRLRRLLRLAGDVHRHLALERRVEERERAAAGRGPAVRVLLAEPACRSRATSSRAAPATTAPQARINRDRP